MNSKKCPNPSNLIQIWIKTHYFDSNLWVRGTFLTPCARALRVRTHYQNFVPLIICNKIVTLLKINVPSCQINGHPCQINDPPSQIHVFHGQINVPLSNKFSNTAYLLPTKLSYPAYPTHSEQLCSSCFEKSH